MKKFGKKLVLLTLIIALVIPLTACSKETTISTEDVQSTKNNEQTKATKSEEKITLKMYTPYSDEDETIPFDYALEELAKEYPNVQIEIDIQAQDDGQKLSTYAATGNLPDIYNVNESQINAFKESGNILVLDDYGKSTGYIDKLLPSSTNLFYHEDGHSYAFAYGGNYVVMMYYNKDLFEQYGVKVPETYEEFKEAVITFNQNDIIPLSIFAKEKWITVALYDIFATRLAPEGIVAMEKLDAYASDEAYKTAAENIEELVSLGLVADGCTNMNYDQASSLFYTGQAAMFINGTWEIAASSEALGNSVDWMWYPVYAGHDEAKYALSGAGSLGGFAVSPYSEHQELAVEVAAFLAEKYGEGKYIYRSDPIRALKIDDSVKPATEWPAMATKLAENSDKITSTTAFDWGLTNLEFKVVLEDQTQFLLTDGYTANEFVSELDKIINEQKNSQ